MVALIFNNKVDIHLCFFRWSYLEIITNAEHSSIDQAYGAGYVEGQLTKVIILIFQLYNFISVFSQSGRYIYY